MTTRQTQLLVLSAETAPELERATAELARHLRAHPELELADVAFTLQTERPAHAQRRAVACDDLASAIEALEAGDHRVVAGVAAGARPVVFMLPGQGTQYVHMGRGLYEAEPVFRAELDTCCDILEPHVGLDLRGVLYPEEPDAARAEELLLQTRYTQPALVAVEWALAKLLASWGVEPDILFGHSNGETTAAILGSVLSLEDALVLSAKRGRVMQERPPGDMLSVPMPEEKLVPLLSGELALAAVNGPAACVVSGPADVVSGFRAQLDESNLPWRDLHTSHAFHSSMMHPCGEPVREVLHSLELSPSKLPWLSSVKGRWMEPEELRDHQYWIDNMLSTVRFGPAARQLAQDDAERVLLEVGPGRMLTILMGQQRENRSKRTMLQTMRHPGEDVSDVAVAVGALGKLWVSGVSVDWHGFHGAESRQRVPLPE